MSLSIEQKKAVVSQAEQIFSIAEAAVLAEYRGCLLYTSDAADE